MSTHYARPHTMFSLYFFAEDAKIYRTLPNSYSMIALQNDQTNLAERSGKSFP